MSEILKKSETLDFHTSSQKYKKFPLRVLLDNIRDEINVGSALRISDALCVEHLYCGGANAGVAMKKLRRVSRGADSHVPYTFTNDLMQTIKDLQAEGFTVVAIEITADSQVLHEIDFNSTPKIALVVGSESMGISAAVLKQCDFRAHIPMYGVGFSMNVICALSIALYEVVRQKK
jgi:tRNA G18 (ribose-2'-O)-methylase SpoU